MTPARYIFVNDQGRVYSTLGEPTPEDFEFAAVGIVIILNVAENRFYGTKRQWLPIPRGRLIDDESAQPFHALESDFEGAQDRE